MVTFPENKTTGYLNCQQKWFWNEAGGSFHRSESLCGNFGGNYYSICWCDYGNSGWACEVLCTLLSMFSPKDGGLPALQSAGKGWKEPLTLKYCSGVLNPFDIGGMSLFMHIYTALQSSSDVLKEVFVFKLTSELHCMTPKEAEEAQKG